MSEVQSRPYGSRGRGSFRGGRGGYRGARSGNKPVTKTDDQENVPPTSQEDQGEVGELKQKFGKSVPLLREVTEGWSDEDLVYALKETDGDVDMAFERISTGSISKWGEVKKKQPKTKEASSSTLDGSAGRGGRGRGAFDGRGRGRSTDRGRGARGGRGASQSNGTKISEKAIKPTGDSYGDTPAPATDTSDGWEQVEAPTESETATTGEWSTEAAKEIPVQPVVEETKTQPLSSAPLGKIGGWAGLFAKPPPPPVSKKAPGPQTTQPDSIPTIADSEESIQSENVPPPIEAQIVDEGPTEMPEARSLETPTNLTPSKDELTESNLEQLPDVSNPPATATAASTVASTVDPVGSVNNAASTIRPGMSGYAASALKATASAGRSASFTRRVMEQQEAVVMPGNHAVDRAAVQFGSLGLNGTSDDVDVDDEREDPETRTQLPDDSPAAPRASLPPSHHETEPPAPVSSASEAPGPAPRQAPGLPPIIQPLTQEQITSSPPAATSYADQYRFSQPAQKPFNPFEPQQQQPQQTQSTQPQSQEPFSSQVPSQTQQSTASTLPTDYSSYYPTNSREAYQNYYGAYGQGQETQQRSGSAFGTSSQDAQTQYATSRPPASYGHQESQNSGNNTPNPTVPAHQAQHSQHMPQNQAGYGGGYPYGYPNAYNQQQYPQYGYQMGHRYGANRPLFDDVRRQESDQYINPSNQYGYGHNQQYGGNYKSNMYGQPQQQYSYDQHSSTPAGAAGYGPSSVASREGAYGRTGSTQPSEPQQSATTSAFGGISDPFARSHSGFGGQQQSGSEDPAKAYEATKASGPSPAIGQSHRPGSAVNNMGGQQQQGQSGFPPPQSQHAGQQAFGGYPQYGGALGNHHQAQSSHHQTNPYGQGYGSSNAGFGATYGGGYGSGRGWNGNYGGGH